ncbi:hypothetical protein F4782DRAFT_546383 [Xylaria castorea]|nr:hypothetical protein F4782DRAFT_546383 [Xylaria castorea]
MASVNHVDSIIEPFDGFRFDGEAIDPSAERLLLRSLDNMEAGLGERLYLMYCNALILMMAAYAAKDLRSTGVNLSFFETVSLQFGASNTLAVRYLLDRFIEAREQFYGTNSHVDGIAMGIDLPITYDVENGEHGPQDDCTLEGPDMLFTHKVFCKLYDDMMKQIQGSSRGFIARAAEVAERETVLILAKSVAKTMVELNLLRGFTDVVPILNTGTLRNEYLVKKVMKAMADKNLLTIVPDFLRILLDKTTRTIRSQLSQITSKINLMSRPRADI